MGSRQLVVSPPAIPLLVIDGNCGFCRFWAARWRYRSARPVDCDVSQNPEIARRYPEIPVERFASAVHLIEADGRVSAGAEAVFRMLDFAGSPAPIRIYRRNAAFRRIADAVYRAIAANRNAASRVTTLLWGRDPRPSTYALSRWWFFRLLGLAYLSAFWSLGAQIVGLAGHDGVVPCGIADAWLRAVCIGGSGLAALLVIGVAPILILPMIWAAYLWLSTISGPFLSFQWDTLLLEAGLLAIVVAPLGLRDRLRGAEDPPRLGVWLLLWLLFRLMAGSGAVKLASGDPTWHDLSALTVHYETQPIPTPVAWWAHHLPVWFNQASAAGVLGIELIAPFLMLGPRRLRMLAFTLLAGLQALIAVTGNYAFFNLLTLALCLFLLDDTVLSATAAVPDVGPDTARANPGRRLLAMVIAIPTIPISALAFFAALGIQPPLSPLIVPIAQMIAPLRSVNSYGLFSVMTTARDEIIVEGSDDGVDWREYEFPYKAGDVRRRPPWVAPYQPRLDWQMWFAALDRFDDEPWFQAFCGRLLEASPSVLRLLARDPFHGHPPRVVRAVRYRYRFSDADARRRGIWWTRERLGLYSPPLSLRASLGPSD